MKTRLSLKLAAAPLYLFLYAPIFVVVLYSFNAGRFGLAWQGFTTQWYRVLAEDDQAKAAIKNTLLLAVFSTVIATALGTMLGYGLARFKVRAGRWLDSLLYIPVFYPRCGHGGGFAFFLCFTEEMDRGI